MTTPSRTGTPSQINASGGNGNTSVTVPADCNGIVAFWSHWDNDGGSTLATLTLNGAGFTIRSQLAEGAVAGESGVGVATLMSPSTGSQTLAWTWSAGGARAEGGEIVLVYYKDCNTSDPVRASGTNAAVETTAAPVNLASTASTDRVVGFCDDFNDAGNPAITGVTAFINDAALNSHLYDVGDATGLTGTVTVSNSSPQYGSTAAISLKESVAGGDTGITATVGISSWAGRGASVATHTNIAAGVGTASFLGLAASLEISTGINAGAGTASFAGLDATLQLSTDIHAGVGTSLWNGLGATVTLEGVTETVALIGARVFRSGKSRIVYGG